MTTWTPIDISPFVHAADSSDVERRQVAAEVSHALETMGFLLISNHGVDSSVWESVQAAASSFFGRSDDDKKACFANRAPVPRGYSASGKENFAILSLKDQTRPNDLVEKFRMGPILDESTDPYYSATKDAQMMFYPNIWPQDDEQALQDAMECYYRRMHELSNVLFRIFAHCLDVPEDFFKARTTRHTSILSVNHYPPLDGPVQRGQLRLAQHTDVDIFTIVCPDYADVHGCLQMEDSDGKWVSLPVIPDTFVVNLGDCFKFWTNGRWQSTSHRVMNPADDAGRQASRQSIAYFVGADYDAPLDCIPSCCLEQDCRHHGETLKTYVAWRKDRIQQAMTQLKKSKEAKHRSRQK